MSSTTVLRDITVARVTFACGHTVDVHDSEGWRADDAAYLADVASKRPCSACECAAQCDD